MSYHPRVESAETSSFLTTRSRNSQLWFVNNPELEKAILGYAAKYKKRYKALLYALAIEGNHIQGVGEFPELNRAHFMRDFNSSVARAVPRYVPEFPGGSLWGRRYSSEILPAGPDVEDRFFYTVLQPVQDGLVERISDYPWYNCFHDAVWGIERKFTVVHWKEFNAARKRDSTVRVCDYTETVTLKYERLPGYEHLSQKEYAELMHVKLEKRRIEKVAERIAKGLGFLGPERLKRIKPGSYPVNTKTSTITSHRPRVLCVCPERKREHEARYYDIYFAYKSASARYRAGELDVVFPPGTYRPPFVTVCRSP